MARILVVDDEPVLRDAIALVLKAAGHDVVTAGSGEQALQEQRRQAAEAAVLDIALPGLSGFATFERLKGVTPTLTAVFITAHGSIPSAIEAMRAGAFDYLPKPFDNDELLLRVTRALAQQRMAVRVVELEEQLTARQTMVGFVGASQAMQGAISRLSRVADNDVTVLLTGESGTGKELAARTLHRRSPRARGPYVAVNCGAIPATLAESELFGHERGAFTDAKGERPGLFERAKGGTVLLDEIGDLSIDLQVKLLRTLQEREVTRVGGSRPVAIDVRIVAATHRDLAAEVAAGRFREDLYWRLNVFEVVLPPLRQRLEDLPLLIEHLLDHVNAECRTSIEGVDDDVMACFRAHRWPGNVRELLNVLKHGALMADGPIIGAAHLPIAFGHSPATSALRQEPDAPHSATLKSTIADAERRAIQAALARSNGDREAAALALGISRRTLFYKLKQYGLGDGEP